mgnify:CR=1 FL=1
MLASTEGEYEMGWYGNQLSDVNGNFIEPYPTLTLEFLGKTISLITIVGDSLREEYPVDFDIIVYDSLNNILSHQIITNNTNISLDVLIPENPTNVTKIELVIKKWNKPNRQAKILEFKDSPYRLEITSEDYFRKNNPSKYSDVANIIGIKIKPKDINWNNLQEFRLEVKDDNSILENGRKSYIFPDNPLIQTEELGYKIINRILANQKISNRNLNLSWRGNPALMLGNEITTIDELQKNNYKVIRQTLDYDGGLRSNLDARRVIE